MGAETGMRTGREREWGRGWKSVDEHRMGTGTGTGTGTRAVAEMGTGTGTRTGSWRAEERRRNARDRTIVEDAIRHFHSARVTISADRQGVALAGTRQLRLQGPVPVHAHPTEGVTGSEERERGRSRGRERRWERGRGPRRERGRER